MVEAARIDLMARVPAAGKVTAEGLAEVRARLAPITARLDEPAASPEAAAWLAARLATVYAQAAALAVAGGDEINATRWLEIAEARATGDERAVLAAARRDPERYRVLAEGRVWRDGGNPGRAARCWKGLRGDDALAAAARAERDAPVPLAPDEAGPVAWSINGLGTRLFGRRDVAVDRSYTATYCLSLGPIPLFPLSAWRIKPEYGAPRVVARARLSRLARLLRVVPASVLVLGIAIAAVVSYLEDPERLARARLDGALALADVGGGEVAAQALERELRDELSLFDDDRAQRAGAEVVRLAAARVPAPFTADQLDAATRVVGRYRALPARAQPLAAAELTDQLERWAGQLPVDDGARLELLGLAATPATDSALRRIAAATRSTRLALARARADEPLDALAILVDDAGPSAELITAADAIVARLEAAPSLLLDAGSDLDRWRAISHDAQLVERIAQARTRAEDGRRAALADGVTTAQLEAMAKERAWDQAVAFELAERDAIAGKLAAAAARIDRLGPPGLRIRAARLFGVELAAAQGDLAAADAQLTALLRDRVRRYRAVSSALDAAAKAASARIEDELTRGQVPDDVRRRYEAATDDAARLAVIRPYYDERLMQDPAVVAGRARLADLAYVVHASLTAGGIELRRAHALTGAAQAAMLATAERTFLAVRESAGGDFELRLALGEIYARLGKTAASEAELSAALRDGTPRQRIQIAGLYRVLGSTARARELAQEVYDASPAPDHDRDRGQPVRYQAAYLRALLADEDDQRAWFLRADPQDPQVQAQLLELDAAALQRGGKLAECAAKFLAAAKLRGTRPGVENDVAVDYEQSFACSGDPQALHRAVELIAQVYRANPQDPIVVQNYGALRLLAGLTRVIGRRVDTRALRLGYPDLLELAQTLVDASPHPALQAELAADPDLRGARELLSQYTVLAPNSVTAYRGPAQVAHLVGDPAVTAEVLERARHATAIDHADAARDRAKVAAGGFDDRRLEFANATIARLAPELAGHALDARTRAAAEYLTADALLAVGSIRGDLAALHRSRALCAAAMRRWPELDASLAITAALLDEAGLGADADAWRGLRRTRTSAGALAKLIRDRSPLVDRIHAAPAWAELVRFAPTVTAPPTLSTLRLARALGDAAFEARARAVVQDHEARDAYELATLLDPSDAVAREDLADLR